MSDLIDRQDAIDALARTAREKINLSDEFNHYLAGLMDGENALRQLPFAQPEQRWIPVTERLPDKKGYYLVTRKNPKGHVTRVRFNPEQVERGVYNSPWGNGDCDILAWMPLPDAYEEDD